MRLGPVIDQDARGAPPPKLVFYMPGLAVGGAERHTLDLRTRLSALGYPTAVIVHSDVVSPQMRATPGAEDAELLNLRGAPGPASGLRTYRAFRAADADIIVAVNPMRATWAVLLRALGATRARIVCICHTTLPLPGDERRLPAYRLASRFVDAMVYVSRNQMAYWTARRLKARESLAIVNGVDLERFSPLAKLRTDARRRFGLASSDYVVGLLAAFRPEKNHAQLIEAAARLKRAGVAIKLMFVGDGPTRQEVVAKAEAAGMGDSVIFAGEHADVRPVIAAFDVGVLCSTQVETFSLAALELLASGVPMVMSDIGGASEIIQEGVNGFLFASGDTDGLTEGLRRLADPSVRRPLQSRARASVERFSVASMVERYVDLIERLRPASPGRG